MPVFLFAFWIVLNGKLTIETVIFGLAISCGYYLLSRLSGGRKSCLRYDRIILFVFIYTLALIWEILRSTWAMAVQIISGGRDIPSAVVEFESPVKTKASQVILANSITMTPGTITYKIEDERFYVHCYMKEMAEGITESRLVRLLLKAEDEIW